MSHFSVDFFDTQFQKQVAIGEYALNAFEALALTYLKGGEVLDLGCGLGNLALAAARQGCKVEALDASATAIEHLRAVAAAEGLPVVAEAVALEGHAIPRDYDAIVSIGLLMFFPRAAAQAGLADIRAHVRPGGLAAINVLTEGTTFMGMFEPDHYYLFGRDELEQAFAGWEILENRHQTYPAPEGREKVFATLVARRPASA